MGILSKTKKRVQFQFNPGVTVQYFPKEKKASATIHGKKGIEKLSKEFFVALEARTIDFALQPTHKAVTEIFEQARELSCVQETFLFLCEELPHQVGHLGTDYCLKPFHKEIVSGVTKEMSWMLKMAAAENESFTKAIDTIREKIEKATTGKNPLDSKAAIRSFLWTIEMMIHEHPLTERQKKDAEEMVKVISKKWPN